MAKEWIVYLFGIWFSVGLGHVVVKCCNVRMRKILRERGERCGKSDGELVEKKSAKFTDILGYTERAIYTLFYVWHKWEFIALFFGIKIAQRLIVFSKIENNKQLKDVGERANVFLISNIISLAFGILGGYFITWMKVLE